MEAQIDDLMYRDMTRCLSALQIVRHIESWNITPLQAIKQIFTPASRSR